MAAPRVALITPLWPIPQAPYAGKPIYETALGLRALCELEAFCPVARYPKVRWLEPTGHAYHRVENAQGPAGVTSHYAGFFTLPWIGRFWNGRSTLRAVEATVRAFRPDVLLCYWLYPTGWAAVRLGRRLGVPVAVGSRGSDVHRIPNEWVRSQTAWTVRAADAVLTVTRDLAEQARALGAAPERIHAIPNGCDRNIFHPQPRAEARRALRLEPGITLLLQVGHLLESKGVLDLWAAFARLAQARPDMRLALVGEGPAEGMVRAAAEGAGLADRLLLLGPRPIAEVASWMSAADLVCLASHGEGCPNVVVEALACGRPVVGCNVGGIPELLDEECGMLVPPRQPEALARALEEALARSWSPERISARNARGWEDVARETFSVLEACLRKGRR